MSGMTHGRHAPALTAYVRGVGLLGPGLSDWQTGAPVIAGDAPYQSSPTVLSAPQSLPPAERRRTGATVKLALGVAQQAVAGAGIDPVSLAAVFTSSGGDGLICHEICETLATDERQISPTRFHNSVHNAAAGYWSIATGATAASTALCAYDASFGAGLLEALTELRIHGAPVLLVAYETSYPEPLRSQRPIPEAFAAGFVLGPEGTAGSLARIELDFTGEPATRFEDPGLERLRVSAPAARALPLLGLLARGEAGGVVLDYQDEDRLAIEVSP